MSLGKFKEQFGLGGKIALAALIGLAGYYVTFKEVLYYNEAGYQAHIRTAFGTEKVADTLGYTTKWFGEATAWPREMTAQSVSDLQATRSNGSDMDGYGASLITSFPVTFLGGVTATVDSNVRIILPTGEQFLQIARGYRNPDNFIAQALIPSMKNVLQSTAQMMTADDYYSGARSEFAGAFRDQISDGIYLVERSEIKVRNAKSASKTAILQAGTDQGEYGDQTTTRFVTKKKLDAAGLPIRLDQQFRKLGVTIAEASITGISPNPEFQRRMIDAQKSQADLSLARLDRAKEEEQKLFVTAKGEREVEEKRQNALKEQVEATTAAETKRQLAIIEANREQERARIEKATAEISYGKAQIEAKTIKETADARAYEKKALIEADGALAQKLEAYVKVQQSWADAASRAPVPSIMMAGGSGGAGGDQAGARHGGFNDFLSIIAAKEAKSLALDMTVKK